VIIGDINSRRGRIEGMEHVGGSQFDARPLCRSKKCSVMWNEIRSSTQGRASYSNAVRALTKRRRA